MSHLYSIMGQVKQLKNGVGVQSLLEEAYKILGNPIVMFNTEYNLVAYTDVINDDPIWNEIITYGTFSKETKELFDTEGFIEEIANSAKVAVLTTEKLKYDRIVGKVFNKNNAYVSNLAIVSCNKAFEKSDQIVFEAICKLVSKEISTNEYYQEYEQAHQESIIRSLIDGSYDIKLDIAQIGIIYDSLGSNLYLAVVDISQCPDYYDIVLFRDRFKHIAPSYKYAIYANCIIIIISTNDDILNVDKELHNLITVFEENDMYAGLSSRFENLFELQKYYLEAVKSLEYVISCKCSQRIFPYNTGSIDAMEQIESLEDGLGIQYFLNQGMGIFGNPLLFHDMEPNLLGYTEDVEIADPIWQELITYGTGSDETVALFRTEGWIDMMDKTRGGALLVSDKCKYDRISWRIYNSDDIRIGCTSIVNTMRPFSDDELVLFGVFSQKFSKEVGKIECYNNYGQVYSGTIINRLISGKIDDYTYYSEDIGNLYDNLMEHLYLIVVDASQCESVRVNLSYFRGLFNWQGTVNRYAIYDNCIIIIISIDSAPLDEKEEFQEVGRAFEENNIYAGISRCFENIYELRKYYGEAAGALHSGMERNGRCGKQWIFHYEGNEAGL